MSNKENLSDMFIDWFYTDKDEKGEFINKTGTVLKFMYEGSPTHVKITRIDRKNKKVWGEHIKLYDFNTGMSHYGHAIVSSDPEHIYCQDCEVEISQPNTEEGEVKAIERQSKKDEEEAEKVVKNSKNRRFRYELLCQDGTIKKYAAGKRKKIVEIAKILGRPEELGVVPVVYYPMKYAECALYSDQKGNWNPNNIKNPHLNVLQGDPDLGEPEEFYVVGDVLAEIEVL